MPDRRSADMWERALRVQERTVAPTVVDELQLFQMASPEGAPTASFDSATFC